MLFRRDEVLSITGVSDAELTRLERKRLVVPVRPWWTLGLGRYYRESHLEVVRWLVECHRAEAEFDTRRAVALEGRAPGTS